jgi:hypothetical protein
MVMILSQAYDYEWNFAMKKIGNFENLKATDGAPEIGYGKFM